MSTDLIVPFVDLGALHQPIARAINGAIRGVTRSSDYILGEAVSRFEATFAAYCGADHAIGVDNGTAAIELALRAFGIGPGDEVITAANTYIATVLAISAVGATPVLIDVDPCTYTLDVAQLDAAITPRTRAVVPVHLYGHPADMDPIMGIAERRGLVVVEDAAQAHGARYKGRPIGSLGHAAAFSFYPSKNLGALGDGGMVVTDDPRVADALRLLRNYGQRQKYHHEIRGYNHRLDTLQAAVLATKLEQLDGWNATRRTYAARYRERLEGTPLVLPREAEHARSVYHLFVVRAPDRDALADQLRAQRIATGIHYPIPIHLQPAYRDLDRPAGSFPVTESLAGSMLSLPMCAGLTPKMIDRTADAIVAFYDRG